jgi:hypothetical protein
MNIDSEDFSKVQVIVNSVGEHIQVEEVKNQDGTTDKNIPVNPSCVASPKIGLNQAANEGGFSDPALHRASDAQNPSPKFHKHISESPKKKISYVSNVKVYTHGKPIQNSRNRMKGKT